MAAPVGVVVSLNPYRWLGELPAPGVGDYLESYGGTSYEILEVRELAGDPRRLAIRAIKLGRDFEYPLDARVAPLEWDSRAPRRRYA